VRYLGFLAVILTITGLAWLLVGTFIHDVVPGGWRTWTIAWLISVAPLVVLVRNIATHSYPSALTRLLLFRLFWYTQLLMLPLALAASALAIPALLFGAGAAALVGRIAVLVLAPTLFLLGVWGYVGSKRLVVHELELRPKRLPPALDGLRIVQLSDLHVGPHTPKRQLRRIAAATRAAQAHIIAHTGDQVDDYPHDVDDFGKAFGDLRAPLGVYAIAGNHDVYAGWAEVRRGLEKLGIRVLVNESVALRHNGVTFRIAGTGDPAGLQFARGGESGAPDIDRTLADVSRDDFCIVLAHNPALFVPLAARGADVVISGHTHHGQFSIPSRNWSLASVFLDYAMGTYERNGSLLYISPGTNYWGIPFRVGALPEVTVITLRVPRA